MRKIVFALFLISSFRVLAQNPYEWVQQIEDSSLLSSAPVQGLSTADIVFIMDVATTNDAVYALGRTRHVGQNQFYIHFMKYGLDGTLLWRKEIKNITNGFNVQYLKLSALPTGIIIHGVMEGTIITSQTTSFIGTYGNVLVKYDFQGNEDWVKVLPKTQGINDIGVLNDSLLVLSLTRPSQSYKIITTDMDLIFLDSFTVNNNTGGRIKFDVSNQVFYQYGYTSNSFNYDGNVFPASGNGFNDGYIIKSSLVDGSFHYLKRLQGVSDEGFNTSTRFWTDSHGNLYAIGYSTCDICSSPSTIDGFTLPLNSLYIVKIAPNGTVLWVKSIGVQAGSIYASAMYNDKLILGGEYITSNPTGNAYCASPSYPDEYRIISDSPECGHAGMVIDSSANYGWKRGYRMGGNYYDWVTALAVDKDGALYVGLNSYSDTIYFDGYPQYFFKQNGAIFLAKMYPWAVTAMENSQNEVAGFHLFPNPSADFFTIDTNLPYDYIEITDIMGKVIYQVAISEPEHLSTQDFANGLYFVTLYNKQRALGTQKLLIKK